MELELTFPPASPLDGLRPSAKGRRWQIKPADERLVLALRQKLALPDIVCQLLAARGITLESAEEFLNPSLRASLPDPLHLKDMEKAARALAHAIESQKPIAIFGDYDADGASASALLYRFIRQAGGAEPRIYIPDRILEGYGPSVEAFKTLKKEGAELIITVDCGTVAYAPLEAAKAEGLDVIVIDHHLSDGGVPPAIAVVNPNRVDEDSPHRYLCGVGVAFLLAVAANAMLRSSGWYRLKKEPDLLLLLDLVALGTVCDVVPLIGANRALVAQGLKILGQRKNAGLAALADIARLEEAPGVYHLGFIFGPRINAGGRVGSSHLGARILSTDDAEEAKSLAQQLDLHNRERQAIEAAVLAEATALAEKQKDRPLLVIAKEGWHPGVIGIVAGRLKELYQKPAAVVALSGGTGKASARSVSGVDFGSAITAARMEGLLLAGGGHAMAAGFTVEEGKLAALSDYLEKKLAAAITHAARAHELVLDGILSGSGLTAELAEMLGRVGPFGTGNPEPRFLVKNLRVVKSEVVGGDHVRLLLADGGSAGSKARIKGIAFREAAAPLGALLLSSMGKDIHAVGRIKINRWMGTVSAELQLEDACLA
jgi:single-stranded-DNA-specific exonuclease